MQAKTRNPSTRFNRAVTLIAPKYPQYLPQRPPWHLQVRTLERWEGKWRTDHITGACLCAIEELINFIL
jgi:hypothetical protein